MVVVIIVVEVVVTKVVVNDGVLKTIGGRFCVPWGDNRVNSCVCIVLLFIQTRFVVNCAIYNRHKKCFIIVGRLNATQKLLKAR